MKKQIEINQIVLAKRGDSQRFERGVVVFNVDSRASVSFFKPNGRLDYSAYWVIEHADLIHDTQLGTFIRKERKRES